MLGLLPSGSGSGPDCVFGVQLLQLSEKHMSQPIRLWSFCGEYAQQLQPLVFPEFMAEGVELITTQEVFLLDLFQGIMELPEL